MPQIRDNKLLVFSMSLVYSMSTPKKRIYLVGKQLITAQVHD